MPSYEAEWAMLRAAEAARTALRGDARALEALDDALLSVLRMKLSERRPFETLRIAALPVRAALDAWRVPSPGNGQRAALSEGSEPRILMCVWTDSHVKHLVPVARALAASGDAKPMFLVLRDPRLVGRLERHPFPVAWIGARVSRAERLRAVTHFVRRVPTALRVARELKAGLAAPKRADADRALTDTLLFALAGVTPLELAARRVLTDVRPAVLVLANHEMAVGRMLARVAEERSVPLVQVQHGVVARHPKHAWAHTGAVCVWGTQTKALLESLGWPSSRISVCGAPGLDALGELNRATPVRSEGRRIVLYTPVSGNSLTPAADVESATRSLYAALAGRSDIELVVKPHPVDQLKIPERMLGNFPALRAKVVKDADLHQLMLGADVVATMWSTTALEAVLLDKPVVVIDSGTDDPMPIVEYGAALKAGEPAAIAAALQGAFDGTAAGALASGRARFAREFAHGNDGHAAERTARVVLGAASNRPFAASTVSGSVCTPTPGTTS